MSDAEKNYEKLLTVVREASLLDSISCLLEWDQETGMPRQGAQHRAEQLALTARLSHERLTAGETGELLSACESAAAGCDPLSDRAVNLREIRLRFERRRRLPKRLVEELARVTALAHADWVEARRSGDFKRFAPHLERIVALKREQAACYGSSESPYTALLQDYEPGENEDNLERVFTALASSLPPLVERIEEAGQRLASDLPEGDYPIERQRIFGEMAAAAMGFDFSAGRLDEVVHPFCTTIGPGDVRITTRFERGNFAPAFFGILHEAGHGLYEQGLERAHWGLPRGEAVSLAIHESQSRMWENIVGRSRAFWTHFLPKAKGVFHGSLEGVEMDAFLRAVNRVRRSFIRVEADEVSYNLHIVLRFELERALVQGNLSVADLPAAWNTRFRELLGLKVSSDSEGCLQDTHWASGLIGYFPTYCLGNLYAAQFYAAAERELPGLEGSLAAGDFAPLRDWLRQNIHSQGMRHRAPELVRVVTGAPLGPEPFFAYLNRKYGTLFKLDL